MKKAFLLFLIIFMCQGNLFAQEFPYAPLETDELMFDTEMRFKRNNAKLLDLYIFDEVIHTWESEGSFVLRTDGSFVLRTDGSRIIRNENGLEETAWGVVWHKDKIYFTQSDEAEYIDSLLDGELDLGATTSINFHINGAEQVQVFDGNLNPSIDDDIDLGSESNQYRNLYLSNSIVIKGALCIPSKVNEVGGISIGDVVYISGATGDKPQVSLADNTVHDKAHTFGIAAETKTNNETICIAISGEVRGVNTSLQSAGDRLHLTTAGQWQTAIPTSGIHLHIGRVSKSNVSTGIIEVIVEQYVHDIRGVDDSQVLIACGDDDATGTITFQDYSRNTLGFIDGTGLFQWDGDVTLGDGDDTIVLDPTVVAQILGAVGLEELSADPSDPAEGKAVFWMGDGTGSGADGDLLYMEQSNSTVATGSLKWTDFTPSSLTVNASDGTTGSVSDVQTMLDGNVYQIEELAATPGFDVEFEFSNLDKYPTMVVTRWLYSGSSTHDVTWDIWNYNSSAWDTLRSFQDSRTYEASMTMYIPRVSNGNYVSAGAAKVRVYHRSGGNASHDIQIDYIGLTHALQGVI